MIELTITTNPRYREYEAKVKRASSAALRAAGTRLQQLVQMALNKSAGPQYIKLKRPRGGKKNKTQRTIYTRPSKPGEAPHKRTGNLQRGIWHKHNPARPVSQVGWSLNAIYGLYHDQGIRYRRAGLQKRPHMMATFKKQKRPHMMATFKKNRASISRVAMGSFRRRMA